MSPISSNAKYPETRLIKVFVAVVECKLSYPTRLGQDRRVLTEIEGIYGQSFRFKKVFKKHRLPFRFVCLSLV